MGRPTKRVAQMKQHPLEESSDERTGPVQSILPPCAINKNSAPFNKSLPYN